MTESTVGAKRKHGPARRRVEAQRRRRRALGLFDARRRCEHGAEFVCGVDEVGRGPLAGPVVAAAVIVAPAMRIPDIDDSKRLDRGRRARLAAIIARHARATAIATIAAPVIDRLDIRRATFAAMRAAIGGLSPRPELVLVDGEPIPDLDVRQQAVVGGDHLSLAIACASVVAKDWRDRLMEDLDRLYPGYGFASHKGYGTADHLAALRRLGPCPIHRRSFAPVCMSLQAVLL